MNTDCLIGSKEPFNDFLGILGRMQEAGLVSGVDRALAENAVWATGLEGEKASQLEKLRTSLEPLRKIEQEFGHGACLDLDHKIVQELIKWRRVDSNQLANAAAFTALGRWKQPLRTRRAE